MIRKVAVSMALAITGHCEVKQSALFASHIGSVDV